MDKTRKQQKNPDRREDREIVNQDQPRRNPDAEPQAHKEREMGRKKEEGLPIQGKRPAPEGLSKERGSGRGQGSEEDEDLLRKVEEEDAA